MNELTPKELNEKINEILKEENLLGSILKTRESMENLIESVIRNIALGTLELLRRLVKEIVDERLNELTPKKQDNGAKRGRKKKEVQEEPEKFEQLERESKVTTVVTQEIEKLREQESPPIPFSSIVPIAPINLETAIRENPLIETQEESLKIEEMSGLEELPSTKESKPEDTPMHFASELEDHIIRAVCACYGSPEQFMNMHVRKKEGIPLPNIHAWLKETYPGKYDTISITDLRSQILKDCPSFKEVSSFAFHSDLFEKIMNGA